MQEPLLGAEGPDYDTFPEKPPPLPGDRARVGTLQNKRVFLATFAAVLGNFSFGYALVYTSPVIPALERSLDPDLHLTKSQASWFGVYVSEIAPPGVRGALGATPQLMAVFGSLSLYALGTKRPCGRWPGCVGRTPMSTGSSSRSRTTSGDSRVSWAEARAPHMCRPIAVALLMRLLQQLTGITPILVYLQSIFDSTAVLLPPKDDAAIVGAVRLLSVLIAALTMDLAGRKMLLFVSASAGPQPKPVAPERSAGAPSGHTGCDTPRWEPDTRLETELAALLGVSSPRHELDHASIKGLCRRSSERNSWLRGSWPHEATCLSTAAIMFAANLTLGLYIHFGPRPLSPNSTAGLESESWGDLAQPVAAPAGYLTLVPLLATMLFIMGYAMGWGPITWLLMSEVLPLRARGVASGLCVLASWLTAFVLTKSFLPVVSTFGLQVPFFFFAAICLVSLVFTGCCVPETKGRSLEQIESFFRTGRRSFLR
ncbi:solute carrier family 2, facilitated glucose transporter member 6 isoform X6 [Pongo abelii]|uniref:solute carrier family 2, facilitated glucose transporter member 6 isoform X6 n=1 Tax=Pongo abelii TaxID=9601 RepID=UPI0030078883